MNIPLLIGLLVSYPLFGAAPVAAQACVQTREFSLYSRSLAFDAGVALRAEPGASAGEPGHVDVFEYRPASDVFGLEQVLRASPVRPGEDRFGWHVDTDGDTIVVSSEMMNFPGEVSAVYIFERNAGLQTWEQVAKLIPPASSVSKRFAGDVAVSGDWIAVGAPFENLGEVYLIERDPVTGIWAYGQTTISPPAATPGQFGFALDLDGPLLAVGDRLVNGGRGIVYTYERSQQAGTWIYLDSLDGGLLTQDSNFGESVTVDGNRVLAGCPGFGASEGGAVLWERSSVTGIWTKGFDWKYLFAASNSDAGLQVALDGDMAYVVMPHYGNSQPFIKIFQRSTSGPFWAAAGVILGPPLSGSSVWLGMASTGLGVCDGVAVFSGTHRAFGSAARFEMIFQTGSVHDCDGNGVNDLCEIYSGTGLDLNDNGVLDVCEGIGLAYCQPTALNSAGLLGQLSADGSQFSSENNVTLQATQLPPGQFGYALNSPYQGVVPNVGGSQGSLCIFGPSLGRHNRAGEVRHSGAAGDFDIVVDLTDFPSPLGSIMVHAGETWNFQIWYRDQNPNNTSNLTNAVSLTFQ